MGLEILNMDNDTLNTGDFRILAEILKHPKVLELDSDYPSNDRDFEYLIEGFQKNYVDHEEGKHVSIVAKLEGVPVGFLGIYRQGPPRTHVGDVGIAVHPDQWRKGIGTKMMKVGINHAKKIGFKRLEADTLMKNTGMRRLAEKFGFNLEGIREKYVNMYGTLEDIALYALIL